MKASERDILSYDVEKKNAGVPNSSKRGVILHGMANGFDNVGLPGPVRRNDGLTEVLLGAV